MQDDTGLAAPSSSDHTATELGSLYREQIQQVLGVCLMKAVLKKKGELKQKCT